jgi:hypothetical protein
MPNTGCVTESGVLGALQYLRGNAMDEADEFLFIEEDLDPTRVNFVMASFDHPKELMCKVLDSAGVFLACRAVAVHFLQRGARGEWLLPAGVADQLLKLDLRLDDHALAGQINGVLKSGLLDPREATVLWSFCSVLGDAKPKTKVRMYGWMAPYLMSKGRLRENTTHSLTHSHTHSMTHSITHSITHSLTPSLTHSHSLLTTQLHTHSLTGTLTHTHAL